MAQPFGSAIGRTLSRLAGARTRNHTPFDATDFRQSRFDDAISLAARANVPVLVTADTLAEAKRVACAIQERLEPRRMPVTVINCAVVGDSLDKWLDMPTGLIFLEDVGSLGDESQALLLGLLAKRLSSPSGGGGGHVHLISTALADLYSCVKGGKFREALFYRLNIIHISVSGETFFETS